MRLILYNTSGRVRMRCAYSRFSEEWLKASPGGLDGLVLIELERFADDRGFFVERFNAQKFAELELPIEFLQDNHSRSAPGVIRGMHYQLDPGQGKLVGVIRGTILDVVADIRPDSPTFGKVASVELSEHNNRLLWVPAGFAHGFCVLGSEPADVMYKVDALYNPASEGGINYADPELGIAWSGHNHIVSDRDRALPSFASFRALQAQSSSAVA